MSEINLPLRPRVREDPYASGVVQTNLDFLLTLFEKGLADGDVLTWDSLLGKYVAKPAGGIEVVTTLPLAPIPGQQVIIVDSISSPTYHWHFRYNDLSASSYKWEFIGGTPVLVNTGGNTSGTSTSYEDVSGLSSLTLPDLDGDYIVTVAASIGIISTGADADTAWLSYNIGGLSASDTWGVRIRAGDAGGSGIEVQTVGQTTYRHAGRSGGDVIDLKARRDGGSAWTCVGPASISVIPQRVI